MRSDSVKAGSQQAPHRSLFNALGLTKEEMERPLVGIVSSYNEIVPVQSNYTAAAIRSPISFVPTFLQPSDIISPVRYPSVSTFCTAASTASASSSRFRE